MKPRMNAKRAQLSAILFLLRISIFFSPPRLQKYLYDMNDTARTVVTRKFEEEGALQALHYCWVTVVDIVQVSVKGWLAKMNSVKTHALAAPLAVVFRLRARPALTLMMEVASLLLCLAVMAPLVQEIDLSAVVLTSVTTVLVMTQVYRMLRYSHRRTTLEHWGPASASAVLPLSQTISEDGERRVGQSMKLPRPPAAPIKRETTPSRTRLYVSPLRVVASLRWLLLSSLAVLILGMTLPLSGNSRPPLTRIIDGGAPAVPNALAIGQRYGGVTITYFGDSVGTGPHLDQRLADQFERDTGIVVDVRPQNKPQDANAIYEYYRQRFDGSDGAADVLMIDTVYVASFADDLLDVRGQFEQDIKGYRAECIQATLVDDKLVAVPWFLDFGVLLYRRDLLERYGYSRPPQTWEELEEMAARIMQGERANNPNLAGYIFQAKDKYEGLTASALELIASQNGGTITQNGSVTINNEYAVRALHRAQSWIGDITKGRAITPLEVLTFTESDTRERFNQGDAIFMREWPTAYTEANDTKSAVAGQVGIAPLPHRLGQPSVSTVGGQALGISKAVESDPQRMGAAIEFVRYMTSAEVQKYRAIQGSFVPTITNLQKDGEIIQHIPVLEALPDIRLVTRPSDETGTAYKQVSETFSSSVHMVLAGADAREILPLLAQVLEAALSIQTSRAPAPPSAAGTTIAPMPGLGIPGIQAVIPNVDRPFMGTPYYSDSSVHKEQYSRRK